MNIVEIIRHSLNALRERKFRAGLTILMVIIGASLMVSLNGMSAGMNFFIEDQFSQFSPNVLIVSPASVIDFEGGGQTNTVELNDRTVDNLDKIQDVVDTSPIIMKFLTLKSGSQSMPIMAIGLDQSKAHYTAPNLDLDEGHLLSFNDGIGVVVGSDVKNPPGQSMPFVRLGQTVTLEYSKIDDVGGEQKTVIEKRAFAVKGVLTNIGSANSFFQMDEMILLSLPAANSFFKSSGEYSMILVITRSQDYNDIVEQDIRKIYGDDIGVTSPKAIVKAVQGIISGFSSFVLAIATVSMLVAAVGVITTLLTSVMERTREIGILKALGFKDSSVMVLFLSEAAIIGVIGATVGLLIGMGLSSILVTGLMGDATMFGSLTPVFLPRDLAFVWGFSVGLSTIAGFYPAWRASRLDPVEVLRKE